MELQKLAQLQGADSLAQRWLESDGVQEALTAAAEGCFQTSLPAERALACAKKEERPRLSHLATASRNLIHRAVLRKRERAVAALDEAERNHEASRKRRIEHVALKDYLGDTGNFLPSAQRFVSAPAAPALSPAPAFASPLQLSAHSRPVERSAPSRPVGP